MSDSEEDFMSDAFLAKVLPLPNPSSKRPSSQPTTYQQKRRQAALDSEAKNKANAPKSFKGLREEEEEKRREGLKKSLFEKEIEDGHGPSKAMKMMMRMGFSVGDSLGKKTGEPQNDPPLNGSGSSHVRQQPDDEEDNTPSEGVGLGSSKRRKIDDNPSLQVPTPTLASTAPHRLEPLGIKLWAGRKGVGAQPKAPPPPPRASDTVSPSLPLEAYAYRSRQQIEYEERKAEGHLRNARRTVVDLDERSNRGFSILHLDPTYLPSFPEPLLAHLQSIPSSSTDTSNVSQADLLRKQMASDSLASLEEEDDVGRFALGGLKAERERARDGKDEEAQAEGQENEDWAVLAKEARKLIVLPASERLFLTLDYLRSEFSYCFFCGYAYDSQQALSEGCPGPTEEDHD